MKRKRMQLLDEEQLPLRAIQRRRERRKNFGLEIFNKEK
jgi:hypothetical protein